MDSHVPGKSEKQEDLIRKYCSEVDALIAGAPDYHSAVRLKEFLCSRFQSECDSSMVVAATTLHVEKRLEERWGSSIVRRKLSDESTAIGIGCMSKMTQEEREGQ